MKNSQLNAENPYHQLMVHLRHTGWMHFLYLYNDKHMLIADDFFISEVQNARKTALKIRVARPDNYQENITEDTEKILVFCVDGELELIAKLQERYPGKIIVSGTYEYACTDRARFPVLTPFEKLAPVRTAKPVVILSTPYADAEFIAAVLAKNGLPDIYEYLGRATGTWLGFSRDFQVERYYDLVEKRYTQDGNLPFLLQTDVLNSLFDNTNFSLLQFVAFLEKKGAKVLLVSRKDKIVQAMTGQLLNGTAERSVWTKKDRQKIPIQFVTHGFWSVYERYRQVSKDEKILAAVADSDVDTMNCCLEDFVYSQATKTKEIAAFFEYDLSEGVTELDYREGYVAAEGIPERAVNFKRALIDKIGLHVNTGF